MTFMPKGNGTEKYPIQSEYSSWQTLWSPFWSRVFFTKPWRYSWQKRPC